ncbi:hypothetical protein [Halopseudomonas sp.]|uniref:hypothetical protein n=1 Tax=Halopseudomonas sp. TaxID=2901191 RepID=UPI0030014678
MHIVNDYSEAVPVERGLYAVRLSDGGWSIADGPGTQLLLPAQVAQAGYHLPVSFESRETAQAAITSGPEQPFDIHADGFWVEHALANGGSYCPEYAPSSGPENSSHRSG